jgi:hypothetical protein
MKAFQSNLHFAYRFLQYAYPLVPRPPYRPCPGFAGYGLSCCHHDVADSDCDLYKANKAPTNFSEVLRGTVEPNLLANSRQDPSLQKVTGLVTGITDLKPDELLRVSLVENLRPSGRIFTADVAADGSFEVRNISSGTYQAIVLRTCRGCSASRVAATAINVVVADKEVTNVRLQFLAR